MTNTTTYIVAGMTCGGCVDKVTKKVDEVAGVRDIDVDLSTGGLTVTSDAALDESNIREAIEAAGYKLAST